MTVNDIRGNPGDNEDIIEYIRKFVTHPNFLRVKDMFCAHTPSGEPESKEMKTEDPLVLAHGKRLGTTFVFNTMEEISRIINKPKQQERKSRVDPDLE